MKKNFFVKQKDHEDWLNFIKKKEKILNKDNSENKDKSSNEIQKLDLHGYSLNDANNLVKKFIIESYNLRLKQLLIITGKGLRSKVTSDPYRSTDMNILKNSVPEYIKNNSDLLSKINKISKADIQHGGDGAFCIFLKEKKNL